MIGLYFTSVAQNPEQLAAARARAQALCNAPGADTFVASPAVNFTGQPDQDHPEISLLTVLPAGGLEGAMLVPPVRQFRDAYSRALLGRVHDAIRPGGAMVVPFHAPAIAKRTGFWDLAWLRDVLGKETRVTDDGLAVFTRGPAALPAPVSVLSAFFENAPRLAQSHLARLQSGAAVDPAAYPELVAAAAGPAAGLRAAEAAVPDLAQGLEQFYAYITYSVTGTSYKAEAVRRFIDMYLPGKSGLRAIDIGGGIGFVDMEVLLTCPAVAHVLNCEPVAGNLPLTSLLFGHYRERLAGRYNVTVATAQDFAFAEPVHVIYDFASLLYVPREQLPATLDRMWNALLPGGLLLVHENIRRPLFESKSYYASVFEADELEGYLRPYGEIAYFRSSDLQPMKKQDTKDLTVFRVLQKRR
ncbi:hypothetical protein FN976_05140 [Caenimonas sedimenti]|uniref:Uncharacterized protein n=1 Tax=Caenimonas sedimenti TaxID=2596921 RepID=A0A562ZUE8_9BURK|nr:class I SAM-dependent methyltransferase [Caenimonas sedimenti]TWO72103.1 hypothetical protein FN976_05140 [Caenimonas sedimenti]